MSLFDDLKRHPIFGDQSDEHLQWLAEGGTEIVLQPGEILFHPGDKADAMFVLFEGNATFRRKNDISGATIEAPEGTVTGQLPYSRLQTFQGTGLANTRVRVGRFPKELFPEMSLRMPELVGRLVALMLDRTRDITRLDERRDKLASLGKLSAGLAHELNNPAAAAKRSATLLRDAIARMQDAEDRWDNVNPSAEQRAAVRRILDQPRNGSQVSSVERSDREEEVAQWLEQEGADDAWDLAPALVESGLKCEEIDSLPLEGVRTVAANFAANALVHEIEQSTTRIFELVKAIKEYSYMDQAPMQEVDVQSGIENTVTILGYKLKKASVEVVREYTELPRACAFGSELNQVWTNLIDNAIDAMRDSAKRILLIRTWSDGVYVCVEIGDTGPGIPKDLKDKIFDPFFTTKGVGEGTGLGLDTVLRIVQRHRGTISVESVPGDTRFRVRIPIKG
jgi:signal transduction histidine kinase